MNISFDIKCVKHFQLGVCPEEDDLGGGSNCTPPAVAVGFSFNQLIGLPISSNFSQICNEITFSFSATVPVPNFTNPVILGIISPLPSTLLPFYTGAYYVNGITVTPSQKSGVGTVNLDRLTGILTLYTDTNFLSGLDINTSVTVTGSIIFYV